MIILGFLLIIIGVSFSAYYFSAVVKSVESSHCTFGQAFSDITFGNSGWLLLLIPTVCIILGIYLFIKNNKINKKKKLQEKEQIKELQKEEYKQKILRDKQFELDVVKMNNTIKKEREKDSYCSYCGAKIQKDSTQCSHCGSAIR